MKQHTILFRDDGTPVERPSQWKGGLKEAQKRYRDNSKEKRNAANREWYQKNKEREKAKQSEYRKANKEKVYSINRVWQRERAARLKKDMIEAYGGVCACCGETEPVFLQLDHIFNDGGVERRRYGNHVVEWDALKAMGWPRDRHQLLCANCNYGKLRNGGICPHQKNSNEKRAANII